jgi:phosphonate transport system ATP-binding protein
MQPLWADGITVRFGPETALDRLNVRVDEGQRVALVGPSGGGKTTLLRLAPAAVLPHEGRVSVLGEEVATLPMRELQNLRRRLATVPQNLGLAVELRVVENLLAATPQRQRWWQVLRDAVSPSAAEVERAFQILDRLGVGDKLYQVTAQLSGGERQRVAVARALFREPELMLADEPVASVDPARAESVLGELLASPVMGSRSWIVSLHQPELAREFFDRVIGLRGGRVVFDAPPADLGADDWRDLYRDSAGPERGVP